MAGVAFETARTTPIPPFTSLYNNGGEKFPSADKTSILLPFAAISL